MAKDLSDSGNINSTNCRHFFYFRRSKARQESDMLKTYLKKAQDDVVALLDEKRKLLDTVRNLQVSEMLQLFTMGIFED